MGLNKLITILGGSVAFASATAVETLSVNTSALSGRKMVGYLEDWQGTPSKSVLSHYTHVIYAFLETSSSACRLSKPSKDKVSAIHAAGAKVLGSVGGASMNKYWSHCSVGSLVSQLTSIVNDFGLDGIDIDYEVDPPKSDFVVDLNNELRKALPGKLLTHAPENNMMKKGASYWKILERCQGVDFISVQYYNDNPSPTRDVSGTVAHYKAIVSDLFKGDASKVVFGMCISDCGQDNMSASKAASFTQRMVKEVSNFGGVMNWALNQGDNDGKWSAAVLGAMSQDEEHLVV